MNNVVKFEVSINIEDFFDRETDKEKLFQDSLKMAIHEKLRESQWVQQNIAHYLFNYLKDKEMDEQMDKLREAIRNSVEANKVVDKWDIQHNAVFQSILRDEINCQEGFIRKNVESTLKEMMTAEDQSRYDSFLNRVADAAVDKVFSHFVDAMVKKENSKCIAF